MQDNTHRIHLLTLVIISISSLFHTSSFSSIPCSSSENLPAQVNPAGELLQFIQGNHVLGFLPNTIYAASGDHVLRIEFAGANNAPPAPTYKPGSTEAASSMLQVAYRNLWHGIDLVYEPAINGIVESTWNIAPGIDPGLIELRYNSSVAIQEDGTLRIDFASGWMQESSPIAWQVIDGKRHEVQVAFRQINDNKIGFFLGEYNPAYPLKIDPTMQWNTFMGGSLWTNAYAITKDKAGNIYVAGRSMSSWPTTAVNPHTGGYYDLDGFVAKFNENGYLVWHTFMGSPSGEDSVNSLSVDDAGNIYVGGRSQANWGIPVHPHSGNYDAFLAKLDAAGNRLWHTFLGSTDNDYAYGIAITSPGNLIVVGRSDASWGIPLNPYSGAGGSTAYEVFVAAVDNTGQVLWNTFLGGTGNDVAMGVTVDNGDNIFATGYSNSGWGTPVNSYAADWDGFLAKLSLSGSLQWHTFLGGPGTDYSLSVVIDNEGNLITGGYANATWGTPVHAHSGGDDVFTAKFDTDGNPVWHTFMGSAGSDVGGYLAVDTAGNIAIAGTSDGPWGSNTIRQYSGNKDAFAAKVDKDGNMLWNGFLGGSNANAGYHDYGTGIATDCAGNVFVTGNSEAPGWGTPITSFYGTATNAFLARVGDPGHAVCTIAPPGQGSFVPSYQIVPDGQSATFDVLMEAGYQVDTVSGCGGTWAGSNPYSTGPITGTCLIEATFASLGIYTVDAIVDAYGTLDQTSQSIPGGAGACFTITSNPGYSPNTTVGGDCPIGTWDGATYTTGPISADCTVEFSHSAAYEVNAIVDTHGTLDKSSTIVAEGSAASFTVTSNAGYVVDTAVGGTCPLGSWNGTTYTTGIVTSDCSVSFSHTINTYTVTPSAGVNGTLSPNVPQSADHGTTLQFTVTPAPNYTAIMGGSCGGSLVGAAYTTAPITQDCTVTATFTQNSYTVDASVNGHGSIDPISTIVGHGGTAVFTVTPETGYYTETSVDGTCPPGSWNGQEYTTGAITSACNVSFTNSLAASFVVTPSPALPMACIGAGRLNSVALKGDGTVAAWGLSGNEFLNNPPTGLSGVSAVSIGYGHALALKQDGTVVAWGSNNHGESDVPTGLTGVTAVAAGGAFSLALKDDGTVVAWGYNGEGQASPPADLTDAVAIATAVEGAHALALREDGTVVAWGWNQYGQTDVPADLQGVVAIAGGMYHSLALKDDGTVVSWGFDTAGQISVPVGLNNVIAVSAGYSFSLALKDDGTVVAWGFDNQGQASPPADLTDAVAISAGMGYSLALKSDGTIVGWGENLYGETIPPAGLSLLPFFGARGTIVPNRPHLVTGGSATQFTITPDTGYQASVAGTCGGTLVGTTFTTDIITAGCTVDVSFMASDYTVNASVDAHGMLDSSSAIVAHGVSASFTVTPEVGYGTDPTVGGTCPQGSWSSATYTTGPITEDCSVSFTHTLLSYTVSSSPLFTHSVSAGEGHSMALRNDGSTVGWGRDDIGQASGANNLAGIVALSAFGMNSLALKSDGTVLSWGNIDTIYNVHVPAELSGVVAIAAGGLHSLALKGDGTVVTWYGDNSHGQATIPSGLAEVVDIAAGSIHSLALKADGTVVAWGSNIYGQTNVPDGLNGVVAIAAGNYHSLALQNDGTVVAWGNGPGVSALPVGLANVVAIAGGSDYSMALKTDGTIVAWGNSYGVLSLPTDLTGVVAIAAGDNHGLAAKADGTVVAWGYNSYGQTTVPANLDLLPLPSSHGRLSPIGSRSATHGASLRYRVIPDVGYLASVGGTCGGSLTGNLYDTDSLVADCSVDATFVPGLVVTTSVDVNGSVDLILATINNGSTASFTVTPKTGYTTDATVGGDCEAGSWSGTTYTTGVITGSCSVNFTHTINTYTVNATVDANGDLQPTSTTVSHGAAASFTLNSNQGYTTDTNVGGNCPAGSWNSLTYSTGPITAPCSVSFNHFLVHTVTVSPKTPTALLSAGGHYSIVLKGDGSVVNWPADGWGTQTIPATLTNVAAVSASTGGYQLFAVKNDGSAVSWGWSGYLTTPADLNDIVQVEAGHYHAVALRSDGRVAAWGDNTYGQTTIPVGLADVIAIDAGPHHSLALKRDGTVVGWGFTSVPAGLTGVVAVATGGYHSLALKNDGTVVGWGYTLLGPEAVPDDLEGVTAVATGYDHSLALKNDGTVVAWGRNNLGQTDVPANLNRVVAIAAGYCHSLALQNDGTVVAWGCNDLGQTDVPTGLNLLPFAETPAILTPSRSQTVADGSQLQFFVAPNPGYTVKIGGTCGGTLVGNQFITAPVVSDCSVVAAFAMVSLPGDVNNDGNIDLTDAILSLQVQVATSTAGLATAGDVNSDNKIGLAEAIYILGEMAVTP